MTKSASKKREKQSSSSIEDASFVEGKEDKTSDTEMSTAIVANKSSNEAPLSLNDVWKVLTEIKANTKKLVLVLFYTELHTSLS